MKVTIKYKAKLSFEGTKDSLCDVVHEIDTETLQTTKFSFSAVPRCNNVIRIGQLWRCSLLADHNGDCRSEDSYTGD
jgi:hypothetical protein